MSDVESEGPVTRGLRRRPVAIAVTLAIALVVSACVPLAFLGQGEDRGTPAPSLPAEPENTVESFAEQEPGWQPCLDGMQCADVYAPLDWTDPAGERITLHLVKHPATGGDPIGTLFVNPGGPGASGADYVANSIASAVQPEVARAYDVIGWDPRGVGQSSPVSCLDAAAMDEYLFGLGEDVGEVGSDTWIAAAQAESEEFGSACAASTGDLLAHVDTGSTVQDLDMLRGIVGDETLNYLGYSYGTYIGARYADAYPEKVGRLVLDGAMDPAASLSEVVREQTRGFELALRAYVTDCIERRDCPFTGDVEESMTAIGVLLDRIDADPLQGSDGRMLSSSTMLTAIITPLYSQSNWGYLDQLFETAADGDADVALSLADFYYDRQGGEYLSNSTEAFSAINCLDYPNDPDVDQMRADAQELEEIAPTIGRFQGYGDLACAGWPFPGVEERTAVTAAGSAPILVVGTTGDPATPYRWAESLADQLENATLLTYQGEGHTAYGENACINSAVDAYLLEGVMPRSGVTCS
ncbi:alpha/beta hydrolase [Leucobacter rhizosphaerae]|uniref:Alpha/beta hydrolase n=1 Tax=Leucobacter rhizosphaerae TaxID=2932245 RepID=A0ABY4FS61_9MICO|nr:alpha/beta hydrolase [Leucobacter rhizosphaerae]UOQ59097.1 alpha/beta hydrolase [Leucobacter rhizosphaerae]